MTRPTRSLAAALTTLVAGLALVVPGAPPAGAGTPTPSDPPAGAPVVTTDTVTVAADGIAEIDVLANDTDPDDPSGDDLVVCRTLQDKHVPIDLFASDGYASGNGSDVDSSVAVLPFRAKPGTYTLTYGVCDYDYVTMTTLTVKVTHAENVSATKLAERPGHVRFRNPGDHRVVVQYGSQDGATVDGTFRLAPRTARTVRVTRHAIQWSATAHYRHGSSTVGGIVRGIRLAAHSAQRPIGTSAPRSAADRAAWRLGLDQVRLRAARRDEASDAPVTTSDHVKVAQGSVALADVLANDTDPDGTADDLALCRVSAPADSGVSAQVIPGYSQGFYTISVGRRAAGATSSTSKYGLGVFATPTAKVGTYEVTYYGCDEQYLTPGTLTVTVTKSQLVVARKLPARPSVVRFRNPGPHRSVVRIYDAKAVTHADGEVKPVATFRLAGHRSRSVRPHLHRIFWTAFGPHSPGTSGFVGGIGPRHG